MAHSSPDREKLKRVWQLARAGDSQQARILIRDIIEEDPNNADAWFIASQLEPIVDRQRLFLQKAIVANPNHRKAREALAALEDQEPFSELYSLAQPAVKKTQSSNNRPSASDRWRFLPWWIAGMTSILFVITLMASLILLSSTGGQSGNTVAGGAIATATWTLTPTVTPTLTATPNPSFIVQENNQVFVPLGFRVVDAEYSLALDRIVAVSEKPYALHILDPTTLQDQVVALSRRSTSVSVSPSGLYAAAGHDAQISYVDLAAASLVSTLDVTVDVSDVVLGDNGWVYAIPLEGQWESIHAVEIASNREVNGGAIHARAVYRMHPSGTKMYGADRGLHPEDIYHADIGEDGTITDVFDSRYHGDYPMCNDVWISVDGQRLFTACGNVFRTSDDRTSDMVYNGALEDVDRIVSVVDSPAANRLFGIATTNDRYENDTWLGIWGYESLVNEALMPLPNYVVDDRRAFQTLGRFVFVNSAGTEYYVLGDPAAELISDSGLIVGKICSDPYCQ
jgi:hypothetical protein